MHRNERKVERGHEPLSASEQMWNDAGHPGWDALEAELDTVPPPKMTGKVSFGRPGISRWRLRLATFKGQKVFPLEVIVHQVAPSYGGYHRISVGPDEEKAALGYCQQFFKNAGLTIGDITVNSRGAGIGRAIFYLTVTTT